MYNISTTLIPFQVIENDQTIFEGTIPYEILWYIEEAFLTDTTRTLSFQIGLNTWSLQDRVTNENAVGTDQTIHFENEVYSRLMLAKATEEYETEALALQSLSIQQSTQEEALLEQQRLEERLEQTLLDANRQYQESYDRQIKLAEEYSQQLTNERQRIDLLRAQTVTQIAVDPASIPSALLSEVGNTGDVQRQVAASMKANVEVTKLVLASTSTLWNNSFEILEVASKQATTDSEVASMLAAGIDHDSLLYRSLTILGLVS